MALRGFSFGQYELLARLPSGAPTLTFLARQRGADSFKKLVCLRTLLPSQAADQGLVEMFLEDARIAAHLNHPTCVTMYDLGRERGAYFVSMEYVVGETLSALIDASVASGSPLSAPHVASIAAGIADCLHYAHELRDPGGRPLALVHGDVSPRNVMVTYEGHPKLLDFGIVRIKLGHRGKMRYLSPEQTRGEPGDRRSDVYALGLLLFEALAAVVLGAGAEERTDLVLGASRPPKLSALVNGMHPLLDRITERALEPEPDKRFQSAEAFAEALRTYLAQVGFNERRVSIAELISERVGDRVELRTRTLERLLRGDCDEQELEAALGARSVAELGLLFEERKDNGAAGRPGSLRQRTQIVSDQQILDERTDEVMALVPDPSEASATGADLWGDRTEHDDRAAPEISRAWADPTQVDPTKDDIPLQARPIIGSLRPNTSISDRGAMARPNLNAELARGVGLGSVGAVPQQPVEPEDNPTLPRLRLSSDYSSSDVLAQGLGDAQLPPVAGEPELTTGERMAPMRPLPIAISSAPKDVAALERAADTGDLPEELENTHTGQELEPTVTRAPRASMSAIGVKPVSAPSMAPLVVPVTATTPPPELDTLSESPPPPIAVRPVPQLPGPLDTAERPQGYVSRGSAIKLLIVGLVLGLALGGSIVAWLLRAH